MIPHVGSSFPRLDTETRMLDSAVAAFVSQLSEHGFVVTWVNTPLTDRNSVGLETVPHDDFRCETTRWVDGSMAVFYENELTVIPLWATSGSFYDTIRARYRRGVEKPLRAFERFTGLSEKRLAAVVPDGWSTDLVLTTAGFDYIAVCPCQVQIQWGLACPLGHSWDRFSERLDGEA